jgi:hypothetical protein
MDEPELAGRQGISLKLTKDSQDTANSDHDYHPIQPTKKSEHSIHRGRLPALDGAD